MLLGDVAVFLDALHAGFERVFKRAERGYRLGPVQRFAQLGGSPVVAEGGERLRRDRARGEREPPKALFGVLRLRVERVGEEVDELIRDDVVQGVTQLRVEQDFRKPA